MAAAPVSTIESVLAKAAELAAEGRTGPDGADELIESVGDDRKAVEGARDSVAARVHARSDDFEATAMLQLLNRSLSRMPIHDPLDWRVRWTMRFRKP